MLIVTALLEAKSGQEVALEAELKAMVDKVQAEPNTLTYILHRDQANPARFLFYEKYPNEAAFEDHKNTEHFKALFPVIEPMLATEPVLALYDDVSGFSKS